MDARLAVVALGLVAACGPDDPPAGTGRAWPAADTLFQRDARFLGADGAYSIDLGGERILWTFGDSFIARDASRSRDHADFVNNTLAIQTGRDPSRAFMRFYWREGDDGTAGPFLPGPPDEPDRWFWPAHGIRLSATSLLLFYERVRRDGPPGPDNFAGDGWTAVLVDNPDDPPLAWDLAPVALPADARALQLGEAVVRDGDDLLVYGTRGRSHELVLARFAVADALAGDLASPAYFRDGAFRADGGPPDALVTIGMPELSVHHDDPHGDWVLVGSAGVEATTLAWRTAPAPWGPWSDLGEVYRPAESFAEGASVYAGKAHPELDAGGDDAALVATYVDGATYFPRFVRLGRR